MAMKNRKKDGKSIVKRIAKIISKSTSIKLYWMYSYYSPEGLNQAKPCVLCSPEIDFIDLRFLRSYFKYDLDQNG
jgi:hypothetical protein